MKDVQHQLENLLEEERESSLCRNVSYHQRIVRKNCLIHVKKCGKSGFFSYSTNVVCISIYEML